MIVTRDAAKRMIRSVYGQDYKFRITTTRTVGVWPTFASDLGKRTLSWRSLTTGQDSAVEVIDFSSDTQAALLAVQS